MEFYDVLKRYAWDDVAGEIQNRSAPAVERAIYGAPLNLEHFMSLLSPAAEPFLEQMAQKARQVTEQRFGKVVSMFAPLYLSNFCTNSCVYCGFNIHNPIKRMALSPEEAGREGEAIHKMGFRNLLLVSGEAPQIVSLSYLKQVLEKLRPLFAALSIEIYPMDTQSYRELMEYGVDGLVVFQETYNEERYGDFHPAGRKRDFRWRLATPERGGAAGYRRLGIGALLGLCDWRAEGFFLGLHARYLMRTFWKSQISISFPRLRPAAGAYQPPHPLSDRDMVQLMLALRLFLPDVGLVLSTRESPFLRDHLIPLGVTSMSAGSRTEPGGYAKESDAEAQFEVADERPPDVVAAVIRSKGYDPVWKDWDPAFLR